MGCENLRMHGSQLLLWAASQPIKELTFENINFPIMNVDRGAGIAMRISIKELTRV